jgi:hypothetical protein
MIIEATFFQVNSGLITRKGAIDSAIIEKNLQPGESWVKGFYDASRYRIENNKAVLIPQAEIDSKSIVQAWANVKQQRNCFLYASDWTQLPDVPLATKEAWATYRQALRDITNQPDPFTIQWPTQPE